MTTSRQRLLLATIWILIASTLAQPAHAYLDPGTGSYVLQVAMASLLGAAFALKTYWMNVKLFFANLFKPKNGSH